MQVINVPVNSRTKGLLGNVDVEQFENCAEAISFFEDNGATDGDKEATKLINAQHKANVSNTFRAREGRDQSPFVQLRNAVKAKPEAREQLNALLRSMNLPELS